MRTPHRPLTVCPVCSHDLVTTRLGCHHCGTELVGEFGSCSFCALSDADLDLLKVFLTSRGNLKELEKHLGVSYPTARARFADLLAKLGLAEAGAPESTEDAADGVDAEGVGAASFGWSHADAADAMPSAQDAEPGAPASVRDQVLAQVASGVLSPEMASDLLRRLG